jgi:hypothetical protein
LGTDNTRPEKRNRDVNWERRSRYFMIWDGSKSAEGDALSNAEAWRIHRIHVHLVEAELKHGPMKRNIIAP